MKIRSKIMAVVMSAVMLFQGTANAKRKAEPYSISKGLNIKTILALGGTAVVAGAIGLIGVPTIAAIIDLHSNKKTNSSKPLNTITIEEYIDKNLNPYEILEDWIVINDDFKSQNKLLQCVAIYTVQYIVRTVPKFYEIFKSVFDKLELNAISDLPPKELSDAAAWYERNSNSINIKKKYFLLENNYKMSNKPNNNIYAYAQLLPPSICLHIIINNVCNLQIIIAHEMGHMFFNCYQQYIGSKYLNTGFQKELFSIIYWKKRILQIAKEKYDFDNSKISDYGEMKEGEWFAELFSAAFCGGLTIKHPLCMALDDFIKEITDKI